MEIQQHLKQSINRHVFQQLRITNFEILKKITQHNQQAVVKFTSAGKKVKCAS